MSVSRAFRVLTRNAVRLTLIAALMLKALVPAGYMLAPSASGLPILAACPGAHPAASLLIPRQVSGAAHESASLHSHHHSAHHHAHTEAETETDPDDGGAGGGSADRCPFAICVPFASLATGTGSIVMLAPASRLKTLPVRHVAFDGITRLQPPLRAPPLFA